MQFIVIGLLVITIVLLVMIFLKVKNSHALKEIDFSPVIEKMMNFEGQLRSQPELVKSKFKEVTLQNNQDLIHKFSELRESIIMKLSNSGEKLNKDLFDFRDSLFESQKISFQELSKTVEGRLEKISDKVRENLDEGFKKTNDTFSSVIERLAKIDEAQKKIESLSTNVVSLQDVLTDKKSRGIFGEVQLHHVLSSVFGEVNDKVYKLQYMLSNSKIVDSILFLPEPMGNICVDSKFPLENYKRMFDREIDEGARKQAKKDFKTNVKTHIDAIASKYIIKDETADQAMMFLPAEAIFAELHAYHSDVVEYANRKKVWIASPTTFLATLTTVQAVLTNIERNKYMSVMHQEVNKLGEEFNRYQSRWDDLAKHLGTVTKDVDKIHVTTSKITSRFQKIMEVEIEGLDNSESPLL